MKTKMQISVKTHPNGYGLQVNGEEFMYFNEVDLMAGFMSHVGLGETSAMEKGSILNALMAAMLGDAYANQVETLKQRVGLLTSQYTTTIERMDNAIAYVTSAEKTIGSMKTHIELLNSQIKASDQLYAEQQKKVDAMMKKICEIEILSNDTQKILKNSEVIISKRAEDEGGKEPSKRGRKPKETEETPKPKGARAKNDKAVLAEIERKTAEHFLNEEKKNNKKK